MSELRVAATGEVLRVLTIMDDLSFEHFRHDCDLHRVTRAGWKEELRAFSPHVVFVEGAFFGNGGDWENCIANARRMTNNPAVELIKYCKSLGIPTVFWAKDDPVRFDDFVDMAGQCDFVFSTDAGSLSRYSQKFGHDRLGVLQFAAQPMIHNPVGRSRTTERRGQICFAGSWYRRYKDRNRVAERILSAATEFDLQIFDRNLHHPRRKNLLFPRKFRRHIVGTATAAEMPSVYKSYNLTINLNTVTRSETMFSRRVFEVLACGVPVVSNPALGIERTFGEGVVPTCDTKTQARRLFAILTENGRLRDEIAISAGRTVFRSHLCRHRLSQLCQAVGIELRQRESEVTVVALARTRRELVRQVENFRRQAHVDKRLVIVAHSDVGESECEHYLGSSKTEGIVLSGRRTAKGAGELFATGVRGVRSSLVALFGAAHYSKNYLGDAIDALEFSSTSLVGKQAYFRFSGDDRGLISVAGLQHDHCNDVPVQTLVGATSSVADAVANANAAIDENGDSLHRAQAARIYATHKYEYLDLSLVDDVRDVAPETSWPTEWMVECGGISRDISTASSVGHTERGFVSRLRAGLSSLRTAKRS